MEQLAGWESFYVIVGSASAVLVGLQFIAMTLIGERPALANAGAGAAFASPTVVHFSTPLLLATVLRAPWRTITAAAVLWGLVGLAGVVYSIVIARRMRRQGAYRPVFEDWLFHLILPLASYATLAVSAVESTWHTRGALFGVGTAALLLLFIGIHNCWDAVDYHLLMRSTATTGGGRGEGPRPITPRKDD